MEDKKWDLVALASIPLIMTLGNSMLIPILPQISQKLHVSPFQVSMLITMYAVVAILLVPIAGYLSDRYGRKAVIIPSLIIAGVGGAVAGFGAWFTDGITAYWILLGGRFLQGIGAAGAFPIVLPFVGDMFDDEDEISKGLGIIETSNTFGKVLSPILGAALAMALWYLPFLVIPVLCIISLVMVAFLVKSPEEQKKNDISMASFLKETGGILRKKGRWLYAIFAVGGISMFILFGVLFYLSESLELRYGMHGVLKGLVLAIPLALLCLCSFIAGKVIGKNKKRMKWTGFIAMVVVTAGLVITGFSSQIIFVVGMFTLCGAGLGTVLPCMDALITEGIEQKQRGTITSLYSSMRFIGISLGPPIVSLLMKSSHWVLFLVMAGIGAIGGLLTLFAVKPEDKKNEPMENLNKPKPGVILRRAKAR